MSKKNRPRKKNGKYFKHQLEMPRNSRHHIIPESRGGSGAEENISKVNEDLHARYHNLFSNRVPKEILEFLVDYFWNGDMSPILEFLDEKEKEESFNFLTEIRRKQK